VLRPLRRSSRLPQRAHRRRLDHNPDS
jgi:hypothetical protein